MNERRYEISDEVTFVWNGTTVVGRIVGVEFNDNGHRGQRGWRYVCQTADYLVCDVHESLIGGVVDQCMA